MKLLSSIISTGLLLFSINVHAQANSAAIEKPAVKASPVSKGYYSIGNNAAKLSGPTSVAFAEGAYPAVQKGYYSIGSNNRKLGKQITIKGSAAPVMPAATKGYYAIERNRQVAE